jgi:hypothetical protein
MMGLIPIAYILNKEELNKGIQERRREEIKQALPYANAHHAKKELASNAIKPMAWYGLYFIISISVLIYKFGKIEFGDNTPYTVSLIVIGIPWLACFGHALVKLDTHRNRMLASGIPDVSTSLFSGNWVVFSPVIYLYLIVIIVKISNHILS